ncbi:MAG TPA: hypothetical protein PKZ32_09150 [Candidatus Melainabacteria bacterium]|nr:hypothetical protein [Candidatus Melainabacteria bacterium]
MTTRSPAEDFGARLDTKAGRDNGTATAAAEAYGPGASAEAKKTGTERLNQSLQDSGFIPGIDIVGVLNDDNPNDSKIGIEIAPENANGSASTPASYDADLHVLQYDRPGSLPGNQGKQETVTVNMVTGQENVTAPLDESGGRKVTTRARVGDAAYTSSNLNGNNQVTSTEGVDANGQPLPKRELRYDANNQLTGVIQDGKALEIPPGASVNTDPLRGAVGEITYEKQLPGVQEGPVQFKLNPDGTSIMTIPGEGGKQGRSYNVGRDNKINYNVQEGDNLWNVGKDIARLNGNANPSNQDIQAIVNQIGHAGVGGDPDKINAGEQISFGANTAEGDQTNLSNLLPQELPMPDGVTRNGNEIKFRDQPLPNIPENINAADLHVDAEHNSVTYSDKDGHQVTFWPPKEGETVPVVKTDYGDGKHTEYRQGTRSIWTTDGNQWYAGSDGRDAVKVAKPWEEGLDNGEIRVTDANGSEYVLAGKADSKDGWTDEFVPNPRNG